MLPLPRLASLFAVFAFAAALPMACGFPDYSGFMASGAGGGMNNGGSSQSSSGTRGQGGSGGDAGCTSDIDCKGAPGGPACNTSTGICEACTQDDNTCGEQMYCGPGDVCIPGCDSDADCNPPMTVNGLTCDKKNHICIGCTEDAQCPAGLVCDTMSTECVPGCTPQHACDKGHTCCGTTCSDVQTDEMNCGGCGMPCVLANATAVCAAGKCGIASCNPGYNDCNNKPDDGCESDQNNDANNCNGCGKACSAPAHGAAACANGMCGLGACDMGFGDCNNDPSDGCESNLQTSAENCNGCGLSCSKNNGTPSCTAGACSISCDSGFKDCDGDVTNGCEVDTTSNVNNCNTCGNICPNAGGTPACVNSMCTVSMCATGRGDCDGDPGNGCETNTTNDIDNCGGCGLPCFVAHGTPGCGASACYISSCDNGFSDCDMTYSTGCEINTQSDINNCGSCGTKCTNGHGTTSCTGSACSPVCATGFLDCDSNPDNGCETDKNSDANNCGSCGHVCMFPEGMGSCVAGSCVLNSCDSGFADCDLNPANGCETPINTVTNCGSCGLKCTNANGTTSCVAGLCSPSCSSGFADCNSNPNDGCETGTNTVTNCGGCGTGCSANNGTPSCAGGTCSIVCTAPFKDCNNNPRTDGCETNTNSDKNHCGNCTTVCSGSTPFCQGGTCAATACPNGKSDCNMNMGDGCECNTPGCCGSGCQVTHTDGYGQNFYDCAALSTYNAAEATAAATAWLPTGDIQSGMCTDKVGATTYTEYIICNQTTTNCVCWAYQDSPTGGPYSGAGYAILNTAAGTLGTLNNCECPADPTPPAVAWH